MPIKSVVTAISFIALLGASSAWAENASSTVDPKSPVTHAEFSAMLREALMKDPDMIIEAVKGAQTKQRAQVEQEIKKGIEKHADDLYKDTTSPSVGDAKKADITLVEFFDYHCGYCKRMFPEMAQLVQEDPKVRIVFREFPILSEDSVTASRAALAVNKLYPGKYFAFHTALMDTTGAFNDQTLEAIAKKQNLSWDKIKKEMDSPEIKALLDANHALAEDLGIRGTPAVLVGTQFIPGAIPLEQLKKAIADARANKAS